MGAKAGFDLGTGLIQEGDKVRYTPCTDIVTVTIVYHDGDVCIQFSDGHYKLVKWKTLQREQDEEEKK